MFVQIERFSPEEVLPFTTKLYPKKRLYVVHGIPYNVGMRSLRYETFIRSKSCACCGITGTVMILEYTHSRKQGPQQKPHFNLYAEMSNGFLQMMTRDHIIPRSKGGSDHIDNMQTMCKRCNSSKSDNFLTLDELRTKVAEEIIQKKYGEVFVFDDRVVKVSEHKEKYDGGRNTRVVTTQSKIEILIDRDLVSDNDIPKLIAYARYIDKVMNTPKKAFGSFFDKGIQMKSARQVDSRFFSYEELELSQKMDVESK